MKKSSWILGLLCACMLLTNCTVHNHYYEVNRDDAKNTEMLVPEQKTTEATTTVTTTQASAKEDTSFAEVDKEFAEKIEAPEAVTKYLASKDAMTNKASLGTDKSDLIKSLNLGERKLAYKFKHLEGNYLLDTFKVDNKGNYKFNLHAGQGVFDLELIKEDGKTPYKQSKISDEHPELTLEPGTYYLRVLSEGCDSAAIVMVRTDK